MNELQVNNFTYNFDNGQITSAQIGLYGNEVTSGEYINASIRVNSSDLPDGKTFMQVSMGDMVSIARQKLAKDTAVKQAAIDNDTETEQK